MSFNYILQDFLYDKFAFLPEKLRIFGNFSKLDFNLDILVRNSFEENFVLIEGYFPVFPNIYLPNLNLERSDNVKKFLFYFSESLVLLPSIVRDNFCENFPQFFEFGSKTYKLELKLKRDIIIPNFDLGPRYYLTNPVFRVNRLNSFFYKTPFELVAFDTCYVDLDRNTEDYVEFSFF